MHFPIILRNVTRVTFLFSPSYYNFYYEQNKLQRWKWCITPILCELINILWLTHDNMIRFYFHIPLPVLELHGVINDHFFFHLHAYYLGYIYLSEINYLVETTDFSICTKVTSTKPQNYNLLIIKWIPIQHKNSC